MRAHLATLALALALSPSMVAAQWRTSVLPVLGSAPETGGQFGVAVFRTRQPEDSLGTRPSSLIGNAIVTSKGQQRAFVEYDRWTAGNERRLQVVAIASEFPLPYYGYGDDTPDDPWNYEPTSLELSITRSRMTSPDRWRYAGIRLVGTRGDLEVPFLVLPPCDPMWCQLNSVEPANVPLAHASFGIPGWYPDYRLALATGGWLRDSRDNLFAPSRGRVFDISLTGGVVWPPSEFDRRGLVARLRVDWRGYRSTANGGVLGGQVVLSEAVGEFPLDQVVLVGHHSLNRGYTMGRYRDRGMLASQVEYRSPTRWWNDRLGFAAFSGVAFLSGRVDNSRPLPSGGAGLRYRLDPRTRSTIRVDYAVGVSGQKGLYVAFNEAF